MHQKPICYEDYIDSINMAENFKSFTIVDFEPEEFEEWVDPYDTMVLKLLTVFVYLVEILAAIVMLSFVVYENQGYAGHYRTVINQLLSSLYGLVREYT